MSEGELQLSTVLERIKGSAAVERGRALDDLKHILRHNNDALSGLKDKAWHGIYDVLFQCSTTERALWLRSKAQIQRNTAASRLEKCASVLRAAVEAGVRKLDKTRTIRALVDHIIQSLDVPESYTSPLGLDYIKTLTVIFEHQPHTEHLRDQWGEVVDFVLQIIAEINEADLSKQIPTNGASASRSPVRSTFQSSTHSIHRLASSTSNGELAIRTNGVTRGNTELEELIICLRFIVTAPNADIVGKGDQIASAVLQFLRPRAVGRAHKDAFITLNRICLITITTSVDSTFTIVKSLVHVIRVAWADRGGSFKDDMIAPLLTTCKFSLAILAQETLEAAEFRTSVTALIDDLVADVSKREERKLLQPHDLVLASKHSEESDPFSLRAFRLRESRSKAESLWTTIWMTAVFSNAIDSRIAIAATDRNGESSAKRLKLSSRMDEYLERTTTGSLAVRVSALQTICFMVQTTVLSSNVQQHLLESLEPSMTHPRAAIASWTLLTLAGIATSTGTLDVHTISIWRRIEEKVIRSMTQPSVSREATHLFNTVNTWLWPEVNKSRVQARIPRHQISHLSEPATLSDSTCAYWVSIASSEQTVNKELPVIAARALQWLFRTWAPSNFEDRVHSSQILSSTTVLDILCLLNRCIGKTDERRSQPFDSRGTLRRTAQRIVRDESMLDYLLLAREGTRDEHLAVRNFVQISSPRAMPPEVQSDHLKQVFVLLTRELSSAIEIWHEIMRERPKTIATDMLQLLVMLCMVSHETIRCISTSTHELRSLRAELRKMEQLMSLYIQQNASDHFKMNAIGETLRSYLPSWEHILSSGFEQASAQGVLSPLIYTLSQVHASSTHDTSRDTSFMSDMNTDDGDFGLEPTVVESNQTKFIAPRDYDGLCNDRAVLDICVASYAHLCSLVRPTETNMADEDSPMSRFIPYLLDLTPEALCSNLPLLEVVMTRTITVSLADLERLIERLSGVFLGTYNFESHEGAQMVLLRILTTYAHIWAAPESGTLQEMATEVYAWFISRGLLSNVCSRGVRERIADLLFKLLASQGPAYKPDPGSPSLRTIIFGRLHDSDPHVVFRTTSNLHLLFGRFVLGEHETVFAELQESLPNDGSSHEGIIVRLYALTQLGIHWQTLLRRCVYQIFEISGVIPTAVEHGAYCMMLLSQKYKLQSPRDLFKLFASQLLYTWLPQQALGSIPHQIFGYDSIAGLLSNCHEEAYAQSMMQDKTSELDFLGTTLSIPQTDLFQSCFARAAAYCMAQDLDTSTTGSAVSTSEERLRSHATKELYKVQAKLQFHRVLGIIMCNYEENLESVLKYFERRSVTKRAASIVQEIVGDDSSQKILPGDIQPAFKSSRLIDRIERACKRADVDMSRVWSAPTYVYVLRLLLDRINPALGPLNALAILRKIRVLVALAGPIASSGYQLEMLLHALEPLLLEQQCADETIAVVRYLLKHGIGHLATKVEFTASYLVHFFVASVRFLQADNESTTQESEHLKTKSSLESLRKHLSGDWLKLYMSKIGTPSANTRNGEFESLILAAAATLGVFNTRRSSPESRLLLEVFDDQKRERSLLTGARRKDVMLLISRSFETPSTRHEDTFGDPNLAISYAVEIRQSCTIEGLSDQYLLWASRVIGRAMMCTGSPPEDNSGPRYQPHRLITDLASDKVTDLGITSKKMILDSILALLDSKDSADCGLSEATLREFIQRCTKTTASDAVLNLIPDTVLQALRSDSNLGPRPLSAGRPDISLSNLIMHVEQPFDTWITDLTVALCTHASNKDPLLLSLCQILIRCQGFAKALCPPILHLTLLQEHNRGHKVKDAMSNIYESCFALSATAPNLVPHCRLLLEAIFYLRCQPVPNETTTADRDHWLSINCLTAARTAARCESNLLAIMLLELTRADKPTEGRRTSKTIQSADVEVPADLQLAIYRNIDEPDSFYGVNRRPGLESIIERLDFEGANMRSLLFRGQSIDSQVRQGAMISTQDATGVLTSLIGLNMNSITSSLMQSELGAEIKSGSQDVAVSTALRLENWDLVIDDSNTTANGTVYRALQVINTADSSQAAFEGLNKTLLSSMKRVISAVPGTPVTQSMVLDIGMVTEMYDLLLFRDHESLHDNWHAIKAHSAWLESHPRLDEVVRILGARERVLSSTSRNVKVHDIFRLRPFDARKIEIDAILLSCKVLDSVGASQELLATITHFNTLTPSSHELGLDIAAEAKYQMANALWAQDEQAVSVQMLQELVADVSSTTDKKASTVSRAELFAKLGHHAAEAKAANPGEIMDQYLKPAIAELKGQFQGSVAGRVIHEFARFCDSQLQDADLLAEFDRVKRARDSRHAELEEYNNAIKVMKQGNTRERTKRDYRKATVWFKLENTEYHRLRAVRESLVTQALENYLLSLIACDDFDLNVLRFFALWLVHDNDEPALKVVAKHLHNVPSHKFILLMNQLSSRLQDATTEFQKQLLQLLARICKDHPFHTMHNVFSGTHPSGSKDVMAESRRSATMKLASMLKGDRRSSKTWVCMYRADNVYNKFAIWKDQELRTGKAYQIDSNPTAMALLQVKELAIPPATTTIPLRKDGDYSKVPRLVGWKPKMAIANGLSQPKIVTAIASDGQQYKQLFKGGNDDLRQDAIMEQVFEQVSKLLKNDIATRRRNLHIRTYKVLPLSAVSGIMEFVQNTMPLNDYLQPAHDRHRPKDIKWSTARNKINEIASGTVDQRVKAYKDVAARFQPVLRYFFLERFYDPDEWFARRLAYTRSTATISMLGHVLGLGDRHCHNILLDEQTGEIVHIDLGVAFEAGRILPIPEVVPFRLTRDIVDAMGINKTEGVFRRCCEFTLEALRQERGNIMTLLNVLRYDPLYSWSVSPLRAKRMQESDWEAIPGGTAAPPGTDGTEGGDAAAAAQTRKNVAGPRVNLDDEGEAARSLGIVEKKLSKSLSAAAAVNELIQQATDERNLALLYCGWSAWA